MLHGAERYPTCFVFPSATDKSANSNSKVVPFLARGQHISKNDELGYSRIQQGPKSMSRDLIAAIYVHDWKAGLAARWEWSMRMCCIWVHAGGIEDLENHESVQSVEVLRRRSSFQPGGTVQNLWKSTFGSRLRLTLQNRSVRAPRAATTTRQQFLPWFGVYWWSKSHPEQFCIHGVLSREKLIWSSYALPKVALWNSYHCRNCSACTDWNVTKHLWQSKTIRSSNDITKSTDPLASCQ